MSYSRGKKDDIHRTPDVSHIQNEDVAHEESDVNVKAAATFIVGLLVLIVVSLILMKLLYNFYEERAATSERETAATALAAQEYNKVPPQPRLQGAQQWGVTLSDGQFVDLSLKEPGSERVYVNQDWQKQLQGGKVDPKTGNTSIPITEAMKQVLAQGLPARTEPGAQDTSGEHLPSDSNSGHEIEKRVQ
jgi:HAMP domain-containing protein